MVSNSFALCGKYIRPKDLARFIDGHNRVPELGLNADHQQRLQKYADRKFEYEAGTLVELLAVNGLQKEAEAAAAKAVDYYKGETFQKTIEQSPLLIAPGQLCQE